MKKELTCTNSPKTCNDYDQYSLQLYSDDQTPRVRKDVDCTLVVSELTMAQGSQSSQLTTKKQLKSENIKSNNNFTF